MPTVFKLKGHRFFFFSEEGTEPPHIHVEYGEKYAKFWLEPISLARSKGFRSHELNRLIKIIRQYQKRFIKFWNEHFSPTKRSPSQ